MYAPASRDQQLGVVPLVAVGVATKVAPVVVGVIGRVFGKGRSQTRMQLDDNRVAYSKAQGAGPINATLFLKGRGGIERTILLNDLKVDSKTPYRKGASIGPWNQVESRSDAYTKYDSLLQVNPAAVAKAAEASGVPAVGPINAPIPSFASASSATMPLLLGGGLLVAFLIARGR